MQIQGGQIQGQIQGHPRISDGRFPTLHSEMISKLTGIANLGRPGNPSTSRLPSIHVAIKADYFS